jgi:ribosome recycling factor
MIREILSEAKNECKAIEDDFKKEVSKFRTGRASISILDGIMVTYYGAPTPLNQVATLSTPEANLIVVQPWDNSLIGEVEKTLRGANLNLNPISDGKVIKLPIPPMDEQRRRDIVKTLKKYTEERKTVIRNLRRDYRETVKGMKDGKEISEDDEKRFYDDLQKVIDDSVRVLEAVERDKEKHIMED